MSAQQKYLIMSTIAIILFLVLVISTRASETIFEVSKIYDDRYQKCIHKYIKGFISQDKDLTNDAIAKQILEEAARFALEEKKYPNPYPGQPIYVVVHLCYQGKKYTPEYHYEVFGSSMEVEKGKKIEWFSYHNLAQEKQSIEKQKAMEEEKRRLAMEQREKEEEARKAKEEKEKADAKKRFDEFVKKNGVKAWPSIGTLSTNPFVYEGKTIAIVTDFQEMLTPTQGLFVAPDINPIVVSDIPKGLLTSKGTVVLAGRVLGKAEVKLPLFGTVSAPHLKFVGIHFCKNWGCRDILPTEKK